MDLLDIQEAPDTADRPAGDSHDRVRCSGVRSRGYGQLAKAAMLDRELTVEAKAIYAYFVSFCGAGDTAFPGRDKVMADLRLGKSAYYHHFRLLTEQGYLTVQQQKSGRFSHNIYTVESFPPKYRALPGPALSPAEQRTRTTILEQKDLCAGGYGISPKLVMQADLPVAAKGLYAYLSVFASSEGVCSPGADIILYHLGISHGTSCKYLRILEERGYIRRSRAQRDRGRIGGVCYYLNPEPGLSRQPDPLPQTKNQDTVSIPDALPQAEIRDTEGSQRLPQFKFPYTEISDAGNPAAAIPDTEVPAPEKPDAASSYTARSDTENRDNIIPRWRIPNGNTTPGENPSPLPLSGCGNPASRMEGKTENVPETDADAIWVELMSSETLPLSYTGNPRYMEAALQLLTRQDRQEFRIRGEADGNYRLRLYELFLDALTEMLTAATPTVVRGARIGKTVIYDRLCSCWLTFGENECGELFADLGTLPADSVEGFVQAARKTPIRSLKTYMKAIIWTKMTENGLSDMVSAEYDLAHRA